MCLNFDDFAGFVKIDVGRFLPLGQSCFHIAFILACFVKTGLCSLGIDEYFEKIKFSLLSMQDARATAKE